MGLKRLRVNCKARGSRGTEQAPEMIELLKDNWADLQSAFSSYSKEEQDELLDHFNQALEDLGDNLFGADANIDDLRTFVLGQEEEN